MEIIRFTLYGKTHERLFDLSKIKFGNPLFIQEGQTADDFQISETEFSGSTRVGIMSMSFGQSPLVSLVSRYQMAHVTVEAVQNILEGIMPREEVANRLGFLASQLKVEQLYKSKTYENSLLRVIFAILARLHMLKQLKTEPVSISLFHHWEHTYIYHLLTCFDLLGQPGEYMDFRSWLTSKKRQAERKRVLLEWPDADIETAALRLADEHNKLFGTKNSFYRFMREILPATARKNLLDSLQIRITPMPPITEPLLEEGSSEDKEKFLFKLRNAYTHSAWVIPGTNREELLKNAHPDFLNAPNMLLQEFDEKTWTTYLVTRWPHVLEETVKIGLAEFLKRNSEVRQENEKYTHRYKFFRAFGPDGTEKSGINRIVFDSDGHELTRDYLPEGLPAKYEWATIAEIDAHHVMYPDIPREKLIGNQ